jgi:hypothetical protein
MLGTKLGLMLGTKLGLMLGSKLGLMLGTKQGLMLGTKLGLMLGSKIPINNLPVSRSLIVQYALFGLIFCEENYYARNE